MSQRECVRLCVCMRVSVDACVSVCVGAGKGEGEEEKEKKNHESEKKKQQLRRQYKKSEDNEANMVDIRHGMMGRDKKGVKENQETENK